MIPVVLESPYAGDINKNLEYARRAMCDCLIRGEAPFASHLLYTQSLDDSDFQQRELGFKAGFAWTRFAQKCVVFCDHGVSVGMQRGIDRANFLNIPVEFRAIGQS